MQLEIRLPAQRSLNEQLVERSPTIRSVTVCLSGIFGRSGTKDESASRKTIFKLFRRMGKND